MRGGFDFQRIFLGYTFNFKQLSILAFLILLWFFLFIDFFILNQHWELSFFYMGSQVVSQLEKRHSRKILCWIKHFILHWKTFIEHLVYAKVVEFTTQESWDELRKWSDPSSAYEEPGHSMRPAEYRLLLIWPQESSLLKEASGRTAFCSRVLTSSFRLPERL